MLRIRKDINYDKDIKYCVSTLLVLTTVLVSAERVSAVLSSRMKSQLPLPSFLLLLFCASCVSRMLIHFSSIWACALYNFCEKQISASVILNSVNLMWELLIIWNNFNLVFMCIAQERPLLSHFDCNFCYNHCNA